MSRSFRYVATEPGYLVAGFGIPHWVEPDDVFEVEDEEGDAYAVDGLQNLYVEITPGAPPTVTQSPPADNPSTTEATQ